MDLETEAVRVGAIAGALVGVGAVLRWFWRQVCRVLGWERMAELERSITALDKKVDAVREETLAVAADTNERVARIEGQLETLLSMLTADGNKTHPRSA
jgi:hypothetical protein